MQDPSKSIRRMLATALALGMLGVGAELVLIEHDEDSRQLVPLIALGVSLLALGWDSLSHRRASRLVLGLVAGAAAGLFYHYESNEEFQRELHPELEGRQLVLATMRSHSPPSLAPGILGLLEKRPFANAGALDAFLAESKLDSEARGDFYAKAFVHVDLNRSDSRTIQIIPGAGMRMAHEFDESRPWKSKAQFAQEIGEYAKDREVARLWRFMVIE